MTDHAHGEDDMPAATAGRRSAVHILIGAAFLALGAAYLTAAVEIKVPKIGDTLGPRFIPVVLGSLFVLVAAWNVARDILRPGPSDLDHDKPRGVNLRIGVVFAAAVAYGATMALVGYLVSTAVFVFLFLSVVRFRGPFGNAVAALATTAGFWLLFDLWLGVPLPGPAGF